LFDPNTESAKRALEEYKKKGTLPRLVKIAFLSTGNVANAKDLVLDAFLRLLDEDDKPWRTGTFFTHMSFTMRDTWKEKLRRLSATEVPDEDVTKGSKSVAEGDAQDEDAERRRTLGVHRMLAERLLERLRPKHPLAVRVFEQKCQGIDEPAELARLLACSVDDVYDATQLLKRTAERIREEWEEEERRRMADLRKKEQEKKDEGDR
jgi:DNA-directed RNA polymerase specialized sigma24 family protein